MIDLNLIPENLRKKHRGSLLSPQALNLPPEATIGAIGGIMILLVIVQLALFFLSFSKSSEKRHLEAQWQKILPDKQKADGVINQMRSLQGKIATVGKITTAKRILVAPKLNAISDSIPRGIWLSRVMLEDGILVVDGVTVSKMADETSNVTNFLAGLKKHEQFMTRVASLEMGPVQHKQLQNVEVADFSITTRLK